MSTPEEFEAVVRRHDARIAASGLSIWVGSEPTFTDRSAQTPEWLNTALGAKRNNLIAFVFSAGIGVLFGHFPARRAARMDPIEALRYE